jgi:hypothetical protein
LADRGKTTTRSSDCRPWALGRAYRGELTAGQQPVAMRGQSTAHGAANCPNGSDDPHEWSVDRAPRPAHPGRRLALNVRHSLRSRHAARVRGSLNLYLA